MNKLMKAKVVTALLVSLFSVQVFAQNNVIDEVVWVVGDEAILKSDVETERLSALYEGRRFDGDPYCVIPEQLAVQKLFLHQAELDSIEVSEQDVLAEVERRTNILIDISPTRQTAKVRCNISISRHINRFIQRTALIKVQSQMLGNINRVYHNVVL